MKKATTKNVKETAKKSTTAKVESAKTTTTAKAESKSTKMSGMVATLKSMLPNIKDKKLKAEVENSLKAIKSAKPEDVAALIARVIETGKPKTAVANEVKKPTVKKTVTKKTEDKKTAKPAPKKEEEPKVAPLKSTGDLTSPLALLFPETIKTKVFDGEELTLAKVADTEYTTVQDIINAIESGVNIFIAAYWSKRHLKEYSYGIYFAIPDKCVPKEFPNDLDLLQGVTVSKKTEKLWAMSSYTDAMYVFSEDDFEPIEDKNPYNGETYKVRVSNGMEFAIYVIKEEKVEAPKKTAKKTK